MGFAQEMKDFIAAAQAGQKMIGAASDEEYKKVKSRYTAAMTQTIEDKNNDKEGQKLTQDAHRALIRSREAATSLTNERRGAVSDARKAANAPPAPDPMYDAIRVNPSAIQPAVPTERIAPPPAVDPNAGMDLSLLDEETEAVPTAMASRGGAIQHFEDGGEVEEAEAVPDDEGDELPAPAPAVGGTSTSTDISARSKGVPKFSRDAALDAAADGTKYGVSALGLGGRAAVADADRTRRLTARSRGAGAAAPIDMDAARKAVDPEGKLSESQRNLAALGAVYQYKLNKDDQAGAQRAAFSMIQHYRVASQRYAAIAAAAAENGDLDGAARAAMMAYANIPNGRDLKLEKTKDGKLKYSFTDEKTGKVMEAGIAPPDQIAAAAIGFARDGFDQSIMAAAGQRVEKPAKGGKGAVDPNAPMKPADKKTVLSAVNKAYEDQNPTEDADGNAKTKRDKGEEGALRSASFRIARHPQNDGLTPDEAVDVATKIASPAALGKSTMKVDKAEGGYMVSIDKRQPTFVAAADMATLMERRNANKADLDKKAKEAAEPGVASRAAKAIGDLAAPVGDYWQSMRRGTRKDLAKEEAHRKTFTEPQIP